jgi:hypothetical protein
MEPRPRPVPTGEPVPAAHPPLPARAAFARVAGGDRRAERGTGPALSELPLPRLPPRGDALLSRVVGARPTAIRSATRPYLGPRWAARTGCACPCGLRALAGAWGSDGCGTASRAVFCWVLRPTRGSARVPRTSCACPGGLRPLAGAWGSDSGRNRTPASARVDPCNHRRKRTSYRPGRGRSAFVRTSPGWPQPPCHAGASGSCTRLISVWPGCGSGVVSAVTTFSRPLLLMARSGTAVSAYSA